MPVGIGIGATQLVCKVMSPIRAAGRLPIITVVEATLIIPGPEGTQVGSEQGLVVSVDRAAAAPPINTVGSPLMIASGNAGCGTGVGTGAAG